MGRTSKKPGSTSRNGKTHPFNVLSDTVCSTPGCIRRLKLNVVERQENPRLCYQCGLLEKVATTGHCQRNKDFIAGKVKPKRGGK